MSRYIGKRTGRFLLPRQINADPDLCLVIRNRAERRHRSPAMQILHLLEVGIEHDPEARGYESLPDRRLSSATSHNSAQPPAQPRKAAQARAREELAS